MSNALVISTSLLARIPQEHPGLHYSLDSRIMKLANRSRMLQVQVLYGADEKFVSRPTHGWREGERPPIHLGGHHVELEVDKPQR